MSFMKAMSYIDKKTGRPQYAVNGWYATEKYDGQRAQYRDGRLESRYGNVVPAPDWFLEHFKDMSCPLDGELFCGYGSWDLTGIFRARSQGAIEQNKDSWKSVRYIVFDIPDPDMGDYNERYAKLQKLSVEHGWGTAKCPIMLVQRTKITNKTHLEQYYKSILDRGGEGVMLNNPFAFYKDGRTDVLLKYKSVMDDECIVVGYKMGRGRIAGKLGSFIVHPIEDGEPVPEKEFSISGINDNIRAGYKKSHPIGTVLRYRCCDYTKSGKPRHPTYLGKCTRIVLKSQLPVSNGPKVDLDVDAKSEPKAESEPAPEPIVPALEPEETLSVARVRVKVRPRPRPPKIPVYVTIKS